MLAAKIAGRFAREVGHVCQLGWEPTALSGLWSESQVLSAQCKSMQLSAQLPAISIGCLLLLAPPTSTSQNQTLGHLTGKAVTNSESRLSPCFTFSL